MLVNFTADVSEEFIIVLAWQHTEEQAKQWNIGAVCSVGADVEGIHNIKCVCMEFKIVM